MTARRVGAAEVVETGRRVTRVLDDLGVPVGGGIALISANVPELLAVFRGAVWSGRYCTAMSWRWTADDVDYVAGNCEAAALFADARWPDLAVAAASHFPPDARFSIGGPLKPWVDSVHFSSRDCLSSETCIVPVAVLSVGGTRLAPLSRARSVVAFDGWAAACTPQASRLASNTAL